MRKLLLLLGLSSIAWAQSCPAGTSVIAAFSVRTTADTVIQNVCINPANGVLSFVNAPAINAVTSTATNPAATGIVRSANTDTLCWRNAGNSADICLSTGAGNLLTYNGTWPTDGYYVVPIGACSINATTGALAAAGTVAGTNPGPLFVAANNWVFQAVTTAAANVLKLDCDITPSSRLTAGKGITINNVQLFYGVQTTALTSITAPTLSTVTYPATGGAAAATIAATGGTLTVTPGTLQLATTTTGQCYSENISLGTPTVINTDLQRVTVEQIFNQTGAAATTLQVCGLVVHYTNAVL